MYRLDNTTRPYAWGSVTAIPELLGTPLTGGPQAELWLGAHPASPSVVDSGPERGRGLDAVVAADPAGVLGAASVAAFGPELPFLMKVLAAAQPLSLQVHPSEEQARAGFAAEESAGVPVDSPRRNYKDRHHKPEMILALSPFVALSGFRRPGEARADLRAILGSPAPGSVHAALDRALAQPDEDAALHDALTLLLGGGREVVALASMLVRESRAGSFVAAGTTGPGARTADTVRLLATYYPSDPGVAVAVLLNRVDLAPGQALYLDAGNVHAYLRGLGIEVMASSDNVLRGGLTPKHVDVPELERVVVFRPVDPYRVVPEDRGTGDTHDVLYAPPVGEFRLQVIRAPAGAVVAVEHHGPSLVLVSAGSATLTAGDADLAVDRGRSAFVGADEPAPTLTAGPDGVTAYVTTTGAHDRG